MTSANPSLAGSDAPFQEFLRLAQPGEADLAKPVSCANEEFFQGSEPATITIKEKGGAKRRYRLSLKLYARKKDTGLVVDRLGVYDVTVIEQKRHDGEDYCRDHVAGREFSTDFPMADVFDLSAGASLRLTITEGGHIAIAAADSKEPAMITSRKLLESLRARESRNSPVIRLGPRKFHCLIQPGDTVSVAFFSQSKDAELTADVYSGKNGLLPSPIGNYDNIPYQLAYDRKTGLVAAMPGRSAEGGEFNPER